MLIDARFGTVGHVSADNDPERAVDRAAEAEAQAEIDDNAADPVSAELFAERVAEPLAFRDRAAADARARGEQAAQRAAETPSAPLGAPCEAQLCGACKALVEEFTELLHAQRPRQQQPAYLSPLLDEAFCASQGVAAKYTPLVAEVCALLLPGSLRGFREAFVWAFAGSPVGAATSAAAIFARKEQVCSAVGACQPADFSYSPLLANASASGGAEQRCMVCQRFAEEVQERVSLLSAEAMDTLLAPALHGACDRLNMPPPLDAACAALLAGRAAAQAEVFARALGERLRRQERDELGFSRRLCADLKQCSRAGSGAAAAEEERARVERDMLRSAVYF